MVYALNVDKIRHDLERFRGLSFDEQKNGIKAFARGSYSIEIPDGVIDISKEKFGGKTGQIYNSPILITRIVNAVIKQQVKQGCREIEVHNPRALYSLLTGLRGEVDVNVFGDVGDSFALFTQINGTIKVYGTVENCAGMHAYSGRHVYYDLATELSGNANYGAHFLLLNGATERANAMGRFGSLVTFGMGPDGGLNMAGGILIDLEINIIPEKVAPGIVGGKVIAIDSARPGRGARVERLDAEDYVDIAKTLNQHTLYQYPADSHPDIVVEGLDGFSPDSPILSIARRMLVAPSNGTSAKTRLEDKVEFDFRHFAKIVSTIPRVVPVLPETPKVNRNIIGKKDLEYLLAI